jgi:gliding motility-associated-like protein
MPIRHRLFNSILLLLLLGVSTIALGQSLIINEMSNGPSGNQEYVEFLVVDNSVLYDCNTTQPPCIDIRGWIFDDNSGYHGTGGIAAGASRFSYNSLWECVPVGTLILVYNNQDPNVNLPPDDVSLTDGNCRLIIPMNHPTLFENNATTPGAAACSYPATGWSAGGVWTYTVFANPGDCGRIVDLSGCEVFSMCYGTCNSNNLIYFAGNGGQKNWYFNGGDPFIQSNWSMGTAAVSGGNETPGFPNNALNEAYIAQFNNNCAPITPLESTVVSATASNCGCTGSAEVSGTGSIGPFSYEWLDENLIPLSQSNAMASNLCAGNYFAVTTSAIGCTDTLTITINANGSNTQTTINVEVCENSSFVFPNGISQIITSSISSVFNLTDSFGCDSTVTVNVSVLTTYSSLQSVQICANSNFTFPDGTTQLITQNTTQTSVLNSLYGCDSIITTEIVIIDLYEIDESVDVCYGSSTILPDGSIVDNITANFEYQSTFSTQFGCDSLVTTFVNVLPTYMNIDTLYFCQGQEIILPNGQLITTVTPDMNFAFSYSSVLGCDSIHIYQIIIHPTSSLSNVIQVCRGYNYTFPDNTTWLVQYDTTQISNLTSLFGCDSIISTSIEIFEGYQGEIFDTICSGLDYTFVDGSTAYSNIKDITYFSNFSSQLGCDSTIITHLTILPNENTQFIYLPEQPTIENDWVSFFPLDSALGDFNWNVYNLDNQLLYSWYDTVLELTMNQLSFSTFTVCLSSNNEFNCASETCVDLVLSGELYIYVPNAFSPNRDAQNDFFAPIITGKAFMNYEFIIFNRWGEIVFYSNQYSESWDGTFKGEMAPLGTYTYTLYLKEVGNVTDYRYRGHVTIVR